MAALLEGQGTTQVAERFNLPPSTVSRWRRLAFEELGSSEEIGAALLAYLRENLETLAVQAEVFRDPEWLRKQSASEAGVLHGILCDKSVRLLEALQHSPVGPAPSANGRG